MYFGGTRSECPFTIKMGILANSEDPDQITHNVVFHQGLHCFQRQNNLQSKKYNNFWKYGLNIYNGLSQYPDLTVSILTPLLQKGLMNNDSINKPEHNDNWAATSDFQQCGILTWIYSDEPMQPSFKLDTPNGIWSVP